MRIFFSGFHRTDGEMLRALAREASQRNHEVTNITKASLEARLGITSGREMSSEVEIDTTYVSKLKAEHRTLLDLFPMLLPEVALLGRWIDLEVQIEEELRYHKYDVAVVPCGGVEAVLTARICEQHSVPTVRILTPFYEFKAAEFFEAPSSGAFICGSTRGLELLTSRGVPQQNIYVCGSPKLDSLSKRDCAKTRGDKLSILFVSQGDAESDYLAGKICEWARLNTAVSVRERPHPIFSSRDSERRGVSSSRSLIEDDLENTDIVVGISSLCIVEATAAGVPVLVWEPHIAPSPLSWLIELGVPVVRSSRELFTALSTEPVSNPATSALRKMLRTDDQLSWEILAVNCFEKVAQGLFLGSSTSP